ncbi:unnamed protein product [Cladocopium goreaui]|uniref:Transmembrane protein n=1 Tax=Cladocopium goreaui TaxID=2562237 RepID=A0A9P1DAM4_9DINO|nr:unnamed protein product [Cladocopium goreaui]CAI4011417.1 unnamed protein product [Cladocopium goreaui]
MIQANKATVVTEFHKQSLEVRNMELDFYLLVFERISTISALLAGFASTAIQVEVPEGSSPILKTCYLLFAATALGAHLLVVVVCTMCTMWGPGHALRGRDANCVDHAVAVLDAAQRQMEMFFFLGLISYFLSCIFLVCLLFDLKGRILVCSIFLLTLIWLARKVLRIGQVLRPGRWTSGHIHGSAVKIGELMGDDALTAEHGVSASFATNF